MPSRQSTRNAPRSRNLSIRLGTRSIVSSRQRKLRRANHHRRPDPNVPPHILPEHEPNLYPFNTLESNRTHPRRPCPPHPPLAHITILCLHSHLIYELLRELNLHPLSRARLLRARREAEMCNHHLRLLTGLIRLTVGTPLHNRYPHPAVFRNLSKINGSLRLSHSARYVHIIFISDLLPNSSLDTITCNV